MKTLVSHPPHLIRVNAQSEISFLKLYFSIVFSSYIYMHLNPLVFEISIYRRNYSREVRCNELNMKIGKWFFTARAK